MADDADRTRFQAGENEYIFALAVDLTRRYVYAMGCENCCRRKWKAVARDNLESSSNDKKDQQGEEEDEKGREEGEEKGEKEAKEGNNDEEAGTNDNRLDTILNKPSQIDVDWAVGLLFVQTGGHLLSPLCVPCGPTASGKGKIEDTPRVFMYRFPLSPSACGAWLASVSAELASWAPGLVPICVAYLGYAEDWVATREKKYLLPVERKYGRGHHPTEKCRGYMFVDPKSGNIYAKYSALTRCSILRIGTGDRKAELETTVLRANDPSSEDSYLDTDNLIQDGRGQLLAWVNGPGNTDSLYSLFDDGKIIRATKKVFSWQNKGGYCSSNIVFSHTTNRFALLLPNDSYTNYSLLRYSELGLTELANLPWFEYDEMRVESTYLIAHQGDEMIICTSSNGKSFQMEHVSYASHSSVVRRPLATLCTEPVSQPAKEAHINGKHRPQLRPWEINLQRDITGRFAVAPSSWIFWIEGGETIYSVPFPRLA